MRKGIQYLDIFVAAALRSSEGKYRAPERWAAAEMRASPRESCA